MAAMDRRDFLMMMVACLLAAGQAAPAAAKDDDSGGGGGSGGNSGKGGDDNDDEGGDRDAVKKGDAAKLNEILKSIRRNYKGDVIDVKLNRSGGRYRYRIRMLSAEGKIFAVTVDARTRKVLSVSGY
jgi:hypothetical protein